MRALCTRLGLLVAALVAALVATVSLPTRAAGSPASDPPAATAAGAPPAPSPLSPTPMRGRFLEGNQIVSAIPPVDLSAAANDGDWVNLRNFGRLVVVFFKGAGTAGQDPVFTLRQAKDNAGTGAKALSFATIWKKVGAQTGVGEFTRVDQAEASTYVDDTSAETQGLFVAEIRPEDLDVNGDFTHVQLQIPDIGAATQLGCGFYLLLDPRYGGATSVSAID